MIYLMPTTLLVWPIHGHALDEVDHHHHRDHLTGPSGKNPVPASNLRVDLISLILPSSFRLSPDLQPLP